MDYWDNSPLNKAHFLDRKASAYAKRYLYDEAIECHSSACQELLKSFKLTSHRQATASIELQYEYHKKQKEFLKLKKIQYHTYKEALRVQKEAMSRILKARGAQENEYQNDSEGATLKKAIFRTIEEADSLLELLVQRDEVDGPNSLKLAASGDTTAAAVTSTGSKRPKDDTTVIEELKIVNCQLRSLISELMCQLISSEKEVEALRRRVADLEAENRQLRPDSANASAYSSPFVFSPSDELPRAVTSDLPMLAPLEMPNFDLSALHGKKFEAGDA